MRDTARSFRVPASEPPLPSLAVHIGQAGSPVSILVAEGGRHVTQSVFSTAATGTASAAHRAGSELAALYRRDAHWLAGKPL
jgi:hypothetical protein